ncbi:putative membrane protein [Peribacillus deserti]|uniref:Membrane protein n=1 Tax=Peribacillus deserti TaxID=673318 RepID=A0ABS2QLF4_9BACI|nr:DUF2339 domain-containing protein [Peribacillus deserti]MBM7693840.1 putative membrane protein [Peribacillus deserti]
MTIENRVEELERKIERLEHQISILSSKPVNTAPNVKPIIKPVSQRPMEPVPHSKPVKEAVDYEKLLTQVWLPRIFIFVLLIGLIWGFKAASDYGFINPAVKCSLGFLTAGLLIWLGLTQFKEEREKLGQVLLGGSICLLMLTTFAMTNLYGIISSNIAFILNVIWILLGIYFTNKFRSEALAVLSVIGGFLVPFLIGSSSGNVYLFTAYETFLYITFLYLSIRFKYVKLYFVSAILLNVVLAIYSLLGPFFGADNNVLSWAILIQHAFLVLAFLSRSEFMKSQIGTVFASFVITYIWVRYGFTDHGITGFLLISIAVYTAVSFYAYRKNRQSQWTVASTISLLAIFFFIYHVFDQKFIALVLMIEGTLAVLLGKKLGTKLQQITGYSIFLIGTALTLAADLSEVFSIETLAWLAFFSAFILLWNVSIKDQPLKQDDKQVLTVAACLILTLLGLYFLTRETMIITEVLSINSQHLILSAIWCLYALAVIAYGLIKGLKIARYTGIGLLLLTLLKLIFFDIPSVSMLVRAILFMGLGSIGLLVSRIFYKK